MTRKPRGSYVLHAGSGSFNLGQPFAHAAVDLGEKQLWLSSWSAPDNLEAFDVDITISDHLGIWRGFLRMHRSRKGSEGAVDFWMRETLCFKRRSGTWKIVHEHTSVLFYDGSLRPAFDLNRQFKPACDDVRWIDSYIRSSSSRMNPFTPNKQDSCARPFNHLARYLSITN